MTYRQGVDGARANAPLISVVIAAYNSAGFLQKAVDSALGQKGVSLEVLIVDDSSDDDTPGVMAEMAQANDRIIPIYSKTNGGPAGARNLALAQARGAWIAVLDSDDMFRPERLADMIRTAQSTGAEIVIDDFASVDSKGALLDQDSLAQIRAAGPLDVRDWLALNSFDMGELSFGYAKPLISYDFLRHTGVRYNETLRNGEDYHLILEALAAGAKMQFTAKAGYIYTRRSGSISQRAQLDHLQALLIADQQMAQTLSSERGLETLIRQRRQNLTSLLVTEEIFDRLKTGQKFGALIHLVRHPLAIGRFWKHLREALRKRVRKAL